MKIGEIHVKDLRTGNYKWIEKETNKWYNLAEDTKTEVVWDKDTANTIENELKKGQIRVIKVDEDNNEIKLEGVEFEVLDENGNVLEKIITDENGEALTQRYPIRDFDKLTLREVKTQEDYVLNEEPQTIELTEDEYITETCFDFGKVEKGFREASSPTMQCKSLDTLKDGDTFTNHTKTVGIYYGVTAEADSKWTTITHIPETPTCPVLPRTGK